MKLPADGRTELYAMGLKQIAASGENDFRRFLLVECLEALPEGARVSVSFPAKPPRPATARRPVVLPIFDYDGPPEIRSRFSSGHPPGRSGDGNRRCSEPGPVIRMPVALSHTNQGETWSALTLMMMRTLILTWVKFFGTLRRGSKVGACTMCRGGKCALCLLGSTEFNVRRSRTC